MQSVHRLPLLYKHFVSLPRELQRQHSGKQICTTADPLQHLFPHGTGRCFSTCCGPEGLARRAKISGDRHTDQYIPGRKKKKNTDQELILQKKRRSHCRRSKPGNPQPNCRSARGRCLPGTIIYSCKRPTDGFRRRRWFF